MEIDPSALFWDTVELWRQDPHFRLTLESAAMGLIFIYFLGGSAAPTPTPQLTPPANPPSAWNAPTAAPAIPQTAITTQTPQNGNNVPYSPAQPNPYSYNPISNYNPPPSPQVVPNSPNSFSINWVTLPLPSFGTQTAAKPIEDEAERQLIEQLAEAQEPGALHRLGMMYLRGEGVPQNSATALKFLQRCAQLGDPDAALQVAFLNMRDTSNPRGPYTALALISQSGNAGYPPGEYALGYIYHTGVGYQRPDTQQEIQWYQKAVNDGYSTFLEDNSPIYEAWCEKRANGTSYQRIPGEEACVVGECYEFGWGVPRDSATSQKWYQRSGEERYPLGNFNLARLQLKTDPKTAVFSLHEAAQMGCAPALFELGEIYQFGKDGVPPDNKQAYNFYVQASYRRVSAAYFALGKMEETGFENHPPNLQQASSWYQRGQQDGDRACQDALIRLGLPDERH